MGKLLREEDDADKWLREHDPYYASKNPHKRKTDNYTYETARQEETRAKTEIPISNLNSKQRLQLKDVAGSYDEKGEFNL